MQTLPPKNMWKSVHARVIINGQYMGLFALTEEVDGRFTRENFDDGRGNLYKEIWPLDMNGHFKTEVLAPENINPLLEAWITQIRAATIEASAAHGDAITIITWSNALSKLREQVEYARIH